MKYERVIYGKLNSRQKENYNYASISAILAEYGFVTIRLSDDYNGADFIAMHKSGEILKVQLKSRLSFDKKYIKKDIYIAFIEKEYGYWYLYPHDVLLKTILTQTKNIKNSESWIVKNGYSFPYLTTNLKLLLKPYLIGKVNILFS
jgi:hypothetical protein